MPYLGVVGSSYQAYVSGSKGKEQNTENDYNRVNRK